MAAHPGVTGRPLMSEAQLADLLGLTVDTLASWRKSGHGPTHLLIGRGTVRYRPDDVELWLAEHTVPAAD